MPQQNDPRLRVFSFGLRGWGAIVLGMMVLGAITVLALGFFVLLLPVLLLAPILYYFLPRPRMNPVGKEDSTIIDGEFRVVGAKEIEGKEDGGDAE